MIDPSVSAIPPIAQLVVTIQFEPAATLNVLDFADISKIFIDTFPVFKQINRAGPMPPEIDAVVLELPNGGPRLQLISENLQEAIMFQDDRVSFMWNRTSPLDQDPNYPGFAYSLGRLLSALSKIFGFFDSKGFAKSKMVTGEVIYGDAFTILKEGATQYRLEDIFTFYRSQDDFRFNNINLSFRAILAEGLDGSSHTVVSGPYDGPNGETLMNLQSILRFKLDTDSEPDVGDKFERAHTAATKIFSTLVKCQPATISEA